MSEKVILAEGGSVNVHTRIKDMCKAARNRLGYTNQNISDLISERFGIADFSVNTVNNFFSERSKATTIYTTGYICAVLNISMDAVFGIDRSFSTAEEAEFVKELSELKTEARLKEQKLEALTDALTEKDARLSEAHEAIAYYRKEGEYNHKKVQPWIFGAVLVLLAAAVIFIMIYLIKFDIGNPDFGIFKAELSKITEMQDGGAE